jgi:hypothetical protein
MTSERETTANSRFPHDRRHVSAAYKGHRLRALSRLRLVRPHASGVVIFTRRGSSRRRYHPVPAMMFRLETVAALTGDSFLGAPCVTLRATR